MMGGEGRVRGLALGRGWAGKTWSALLGCAKRTTSASLLSLVAGCRGYQGEGGQHQPANANLTDAADGSSCDGGGGAQRARRLAVELILREPPPPYGWR